MKNILSYILSVGFYLCFGLALVIFHPIQWISFNLFGYKAHKKSVDVLQNQDIRQGIKDYSDWPTIPQLYIKNEFIGGCDIIKEMFENGELKKVLKDKNIPHKS